MNYSGTHGTEEALAAYEDIKESIRTLRGSCTTKGTEQLSRDLLKLSDIITGEDNSKWYKIRMKTMFEPKFLKAANTELTELAGVKCHLEFEHGIPYDDKITATGLFADDDSWHYVTDEVDSLIKIVMAFRGLINSGGIPELKKLLEEKE